MDSPSEDSHAILECTSEPGVTLSVKAGDVIGREGDVDVSKLSDAKYMSRKHARFAFKRNKWHIKNLSTKSFTYVNGKQVEPGAEVEILSGDRLTFGIIRCTFRAEA